MYTILLTGGAGYIGSHTAVQLANTGRYRVIIVDNFSNSCAEVIDVVKKLSPPNTVEFHKLDIVTEVQKLRKLKYDGVVHFAALKAVGESVELPLMYYKNNVNCIINVAEAARDCGARTFLFSSSATVYRPAEGLLDENAALGASNPYGQTKIIGETILQDLFVSDKSWNIINLRYFNPIGAHPSGLMGEDARKASNLMPAIHRSLFANQTLQIFGSDWNTNDGTGVRDYVHVLDLADGHVAALDYLFRRESGCCEFFNLGTGKGFSVLELIKSFERASGRTIPAVQAPRRPGDLAKVIADPAKSERELHFKARRDVDECCRDSWKWMSTHPTGYQQPDTEDPSKN